MRFKSAKWLEKDENTLSKTLEIQTAENELAQVWESNTLRIKSFKNITISGCKHLKIYFFQFYKKEYHKYNTFFS